MKTSFSTVLDSVISLFSKWADRKNQPLSLRSAQYASAKDYRTSEWSTPGVNVNDIIKNSSSAVRDHARQLVRDFPYFASAINRIVEYTVGEGLTFQSRIRTPNGNLDKKAIQAIEDAFNFWADEADIAGKLHYYELMQLAKRQDIESGEFLIVKTLSNDRSRFLPYALQIFESEWLTGRNSTPKSKHAEIDQGIEFDRRTGRVIAYHFTNPDTYYSAGEPIRITQNQIIHGFQTLRPGQLRGISPFATAIMVAKDLSDYMDAEIDAAKMAAKYLALVTTPDPHSFQAGRGLTTDTAGKKIDEMENAIVEYLRPGEDIKIASNPRPGSNFPPFVKLILTMIGISVGVPYELLSGDYAGMNYTVSRSARNDFAHLLKPVTKRHVRQFCKPTFDPFVESAVLNGKLPFRSYFRNPAPYHRSEWQAPGMESVDPLRETKARIDEVKACLRSPQEIVASRGRDLEEVYKEIKAAKEMAEEMGLDFNEIFAVGTGVANNPAALDGDGDKDKDDKERAEIIRFIERTS